MKGKTYLQVLMVAARNGTVIEQIALRCITLRLGGMRWTLRLKLDGLWHPAA